MKNKLKRIIPLISCFAIVLACLVVPVKVSADAIVKSFVNLMPATSYRYSENGVAVGEATKPFRFFQSVTSASWRWNTALLDTSFVSFVITIQVQRGIKPSKVTMIPYVGASPITLTEIGSSGDYVQYSCNQAVNLSYTEIVAEWSSAYTGRFNVVSFYGIQGDLISIPKAARQVTRYVSSYDGFYRMEPSSAGAESLPLYLESALSDGSSVFYDVYNFGIRKSLIPLKYLEEMTFFFATTSAEANPSVYVADDQNLWSTSAIYKTLPVDVSLSFTADTVQMGRYYNLYYYSATVDLSGVDLTDKMINLTFEATPVGDNDTVAFLFYVVARPPVEDIPWYQTFYQWMKGLFDSNTNSLVGAIGSGNSNLVNGTPEQQQQVAEGKDKMESGANDLGQLNEDMKVDQPDIDTSKFTADELIGASGMRLLGTPFLKLWESDLLSAIVVLVVSVSLISYVFFGKKG